MALNTRRVARELALLTISQLGPLAEGARPPLAELVARAADTLAGEARERIVTSTARLQQIRGALVEVGEGEFSGALLYEILKGASRTVKTDDHALERVATAFWRSARELASEDLARLGGAQELVQQAVGAIGELEEAIELLAEALDWPAKAAVADSEAVRNFAIKMITRYQEHSEEIDQAIDQAAEHWSIERMAALDRDVLRLATAELRFDPSVPVEVAVNEAVELAKNYGTEDSGRFVNGVLSRFAAEATQARS